MEFRILGLRKSLELRQEDRWSDQLGRVAHLSFVNQICTRSTSVTNVGSFNLSGMRSCFLGQIKLAIYISNLH